MANVRHRDVFFGANQAGKAVTVKVGSATGADATLTSDRNGAVPLSNPVTVAADGVLEFCAPAGRYVLVGGGQTKEITLRDGGAPNDPLSVPTVTGSRAAYNAAHTTAILQALSRAGLINDNTTA